MHLNPQRLFLCIPSVESRVTRHSPLNNALHQGALRSRYLIQHHAPSHQATRPERVSTPRSSENDPRRTPQKSVSIFIPPRLGLGPGSLAPGSAAPAKVWALSGNKAAKAMVVGGGDGCHISIDHTLLWQAADPMDWVWSLFGDDLRGSGRVCKKLSSCRWMAVACGLPEDPAAVGY